MRAVIQRVKYASVTVEEKEIAKINEGILVLLGVASLDNHEDIDYLVKKIINMRIFDDQDGKINLSLKDIDGELLIVSQFTLLASTKKGNRPSFINAAPPDMAKELYEEFCTAAQIELGKKVEVGIFAADMKVSLLNDGPFTIIIDSKDR